jgi:hypothetical protein
VRPGRARKVGEARVVFRRIYVLAFGQSLITSGTVAHRVADLIGVPSFA